MRRLFWPTVSGILYFLSWIGFGIWPLAFVCFVPLLWELRNATPRQALWLGAWMGFVTHLGGYTWIIHLLKTFAFAPLPLAVLGYLAICAAQGFLFGVCAFLLRWLWLHTGFRIVALLPLTLVTTEFAYPLLFQSYTGVALMPVLPLVQIADLGGPLALSALQAVVNGAIFDTFLSWREGTPPPRWALWASLISLAGSGAYGFYRILRVEEAQKLAPAVRVGLAQPNVGEIELHENPVASVRTLWQQSAELHGRGAELIIWPEVGFNLRPVHLTDNGKSITGGVPDWVIAGVERVTSTEAFNTALMIDPQGRIVGHYDKIKLLAFGEYIPGGEWFPQLYRWSPVASHLTRGTTTAPLKGPRDHRFATFICYEDILPGIVRETMKDHGNGRAHAMVNLTNDSWYGAGHEQEQHLMLAAVRSIEHRRWLLRATSTGISAFVDATGKVVQRIPRNERGVAARDVPMMQGTTVYQRLGDWPGWLALSVVAGLFFWGRGRG